MKKIIIAFLFILSGICSYAQTAEQLAWNGLKALVTKKYEKAFELLSQSIAIDSNSYAFALRGVAFAETGDLDNALRDMTTSIKIDSERASYYCNRGNTYLALKEYMKAMDDFYNELRFLGKFDVIQQRSPDEVKAQIEVCRRLLKKTQG